MKNGFTQHHFCLKGNRESLPSTGFREKSGAGFSLVEILVVFFIIATLTTILITNFAKGKQQFALQRAAHKIIQDLRKAQEMSMSARLEEICPGDEKANGFGIYFNESSPNSYLLFANCDEIYSYNTTDDIILEDIDLERGIKIFSLSSIFLSVAFVPPSPLVYVNGSFALEPAQIVICLEKDDSKTKIIEVNEAGLIEIK